MDSGTHLVFGLGLGGLALTDPVISSHPYGPVAVLIGTVLGSQAPDADTVLRFKSNADYIRNHRGLSHSLPALACWAALLTLILSLAFRTVPWTHLLLWILIAVLVHVATDLFNSYGTQAFRPFTRKWIAWNVIHIFDPAIFLSHLAAILLWATAGPSRGSSSLSCIRSWRCITDGERSFTAAWPRSCPGKTPIGGKATATRCCRRCR